MPIDEATRKIEVLDSTGTVVDTPTVTAAETAGQFTGPLTIAMIPTGKATVRCSASDTNVPPRTGTGTATIFVDAGPNVTTNTPAPDSIHSQLQPVDFEFVVDPAELLPSDSGAEVTAVTMDVAGFPFTLAPQSEGSNVYVASVDFTDALSFGGTTPEGTVAVVLHATNARGVTRSVAYDMVVDGTGPTVDISAPTPASVIGGRVTLTFTVADEQSSVDETSVGVTVNGTTNVYDPAAGSIWARNGNTFSFEFDTMALGATSQVQMTVNVTAKDVAGNASNGKSAVYYIDNLAPIVSIDPPNARTRRTTGNATVAECSLAYNPIGGQTSGWTGYAGPPHSGDGVQQAIRMFRAFVYDRTNSIVGQEVFYYSDVRDSSVRLYLQPDATKGLLKDTNGDGVCDDIDTTGTQFQALVPLPLAGSAWWAPIGGASTETTQTEPQMSNLLGTGSAQCGTAGYVAGPANETFLPTPLCNGLSDMYFVPTRTLGGVPRSIIFAIGPITSVACTGQQWEIGQYIPTEGWVCLAARAEDNVGNVGISAPMALCFDDPARPGTPGCLDHLDEAPSCSQSCTYTAPTPPPVLQ